MELKVSNDRLKELIGIRDAAEHGARTAKQLAEACTKEVQLACDHPIDSVVEAEYSRGDYGDSQKPYRVCKQCGFAEEGWNCGNQVLEDFSVEMTQDQAYKYVKGPIFKNHYFVPRFGQDKTERELYEYAVRNGRGFKDE